VLKQSARNRQPLSLPSAQLQSSFPNRRFIAFWQLCDEFMRARRLGRRIYVFFLGVGPSVGDIVENRIVEQKSVLRNDADFFAQAAQPDMPNIVPINLNG